MYGGPPGDDMPSEFDECSLCGKATSLLIWIRLADILAGICGDCVGALNKGYKEMMRKRMAFQLREVGDK